MRLVIALLLLGLVGSAHADRPHVYLVVVDGLDARLAAPALMPRLFATLKREPARSSVFPVARGVMPARTNPNHVSLLTGVYPEAHGITGNAFWNRTVGEAPEKLDSGALIEVETLFTVAAAAEPPLVTVGVFAKDKLARLFATVSGRQRAPTRTWAGEPGSAGDDAATVAAALGFLERPEPDLAVIALAGVDRVAHAAGPDGSECEQAVRGADAAIGEIVDQLRALGRWGRSVLIVTADHGFTAVMPTRELPYPLITFGRDLAQAKVHGVHLVADGGIEHVYADGLRPDSDAVGDAAAVLGRVGQIAAATPGIAEVVARLAVPGVTPLATAHPDWHLAHPRTGELLLVASPGYHFADPFDPADAGLRGEHGGPETLFVPLIVTGGAPQLTAAPAGAPPPAIVDVAPTIEQLLGLRAARRTDGSPVPAALTGRPLTALLTPTRDSVSGRRQTPRMPPGGRGRRHAAAGEAGAADVPEREG